MKNALLYQLIVDLEKASTKQKVQIWNRVAEELSAPRQNLREVNVTKLAKNTAKSDTVLVPGKVLGTGSIDHAITVVAYAWSEAAAKKIIAAGGKIHSIKDELGKNAKGANLRIIG
jgi:large subunit ribosomal protein L18e